MGVHSFLPVSKQGGKSAGVHSFFITAWYTPSIKINPGSINVEVNSIVSGMHAGHQCCIHCQSNNY